MSENTIESVIDIEVVGEVTCNYPCVPECTRKHAWDEKEESK